MRGTVEILAQSDPRANRFIHDLLSSKIEQLRAAGVIFFGDIRFDIAEYVAMLSIQGYDVGIATLALKDELGIYGPHIISLWIQPEARQSDNRYAVEMIRLLVETSLEKYQQVPSFLPVTESEYRAAMAAKKDGVRIHIKEGTHIYVPGL
jgi:hypothetical protein